MPKKTFVLKCEIPVLIGQLTYLLLYGCGASDECKFYEFASGEAVGGCVEEC